MPFFWDAINLGSKINYIDLDICDFMSGGTSYKRHLSSIKDIYFSLKYIQKVNVFVILLALIKRFFIFYLIVLREVIVLKFYSL